MAAPVVSEMAPPVVAADEPATTETAPLVAFAKAELADRKSVV